MVPILFNVRMPTGVIPRRLSESISVSPQNFTPIALLSDEYVLIVNAQPSYQPAIQLSIHPTQLINVCLSNKSPYLLLGRNFGLYLLLCKMKRSKDLFYAYITFASTYIRTSTCVRTHIRDAAVFLPSLSLFFFYPADPQVITREVYQEFQPSYDIFPRWCQGLLRPQVLCPQPTLPNC